MTRSAPAKPLRHLQIGDLGASREPVILQTLLGSCVSTCLFDPVAAIGGMNHIFLPGSPGPGRFAGSTRFGINAIEMLIHEIVELGGVRSRLQAKVFGGAKTLRNVPSTAAPGAKNVEFVDGFLKREGIPVLEQDVGGSDTRVVQFHTDTGVVLLRRLPPDDAAAILDEETRFRDQMRADLGPDGGSLPPR